jgi:RNA ligase (TIGR02306 family)
MRKLASIQKILDIQPIPGADAIEVATINSWRVVVKKNEFIVGELVVYFEIDSWIPTALAPFLSKGGQEPREYEGVKGERLRTVRLRGQLSQGLILPTSTLRNIPDLIPNSMPICVFEGEDYTELLGVKKYDPPVPARLAGVAKGLFPTVAPKSDEERIQNLTNEWLVLSAYTYEVTEKIEGSSMSMLMIDGEFNVCSRNLNLKETEGNSLWEVARKYDVETKMRDLGYDNVMVQGEIYGEGIEGNHYGIKGQDFMVYAIYDITQRKYVSPENRLSMCEKLGLKHVPIISVAMHLEGVTIDSVLKLADGNSLVNTAKLREGLVFKRVDGQEHWKAVSNEYLIKHGSR